MAATDGDEESVGGVAAEAASSKIPAVEEEPIAEPATEQMYPQSADDEWAAFTSRKSKKKKKPAFVWDEAPEPKPEPVEMAKVVEYDPWTGGRSLGYK